MRDLPMIEMENLILRSITGSDTDDIISWRNNPRVKQQFIYREDFMVQTHTEWMETQVKTGNVVQYIIMEKESGHSIGSVYYRDIDCRNKSAEFGIFIGDDRMRGKGYGTSVMNTFVDFGFTGLGFHRIMLRVLEGNDVAIRMYKRCGFEVEGIFRDMVYLDHAFQNVIFMSKINANDY